MASAVMCTLTNRSNYGSACICARHTAFFQCEAVGTDEMQASSAIARDKSSVARAS